MNVRFGILPFGDQTIAVIGVKQGWFDDVGITLQEEPNGTPVLPDQTVPLLVNGQIDIETVWTPLFIQSMAQAPNLRIFSWVDTFYGTFVLAAPETGAKPIKEFIDSGESFDEAIKSTLAQVRGKRLAIDNTGNNLAFYNTALGRMGGLNLEDDTELAVVDDPRIVQLAIGQKIDFATPSGAPQVARLLEEDWTRFSVSRTSCGTAHPGQLRSRWSLWNGNDREVPRGESRHHSEVPVGDVPDHRCSLGRS